MKEETKTKIITATSIIAFLIILCLFVWLLLPQYETQEFEVFVDYNNDKDQYECYCLELGYVYVSPDRVQIRYFYGGETPILRRVVETRKITNKDKITYTLYLFIDTKMEV